MEHAFSDAIYSQRLQLSATQYRLSSCAKCDTRAPPPSCAHTFAQQMLNDLLTTALMKRYFSNFIRGACILRIHKWFQLLPSRTSYGHEMNGRTGSRSPCTFDERTHTHTRSPWIFKLKWYENAKWPWQTREKNERQKKKNKIKFSSHTREQRERAWAAPQTISDSIKYVFRWAKKLSRVQCV